MSEQSSDNTQHINASDGTQQLRNVIGASSAIPNTNDVSSDDVNSSKIVKQMAHPNSEKKNCDRSGDDISTIGASDQEQEISTTYSIVAELVDVINEKDGNSLLVFHDNQTDEGSAVPANETEQNTDHDMSNDLNTDNVKDIPDQTDVSAKNSENGNVLDNAESN